MKNMESNKVKKKRDPNKWFKLQGGLLWHHGHRSPVDAAINAVCGKQFASDRLLKIQKTMPDDLGRVCYKCWRINAGTN